MNQQGPFVHRFRVPVNMNRANQSQSVAKPPNFNSRGGGGGAPKKTRKQVSENTDESPCMCDSCLAQSSSPRPIPRVEEAGRYTVISSSDPSDHVSDRVSDVSKVKQRSRVAGVAPNEGPGGMSSLIGGLSNIVRSGPGGLITALVGTAGVVGTLGAWAINNYNKNGTINNLARICKNGDECTFLLRPLFLQTFTLVDAPVPGGQGLAGAAPLGAQAQGEGVEVKRRVPPLVVPNGNGNLPTRVRMEHQGEKRGIELMVTVASKRDKTVVIKRRLGENGHDQALTVNCSDPVNPFLEFVPFESNNHHARLWRLDFPTQGTFDPLANSSFSSEAVAFSLSYTQGDNTYFMAMRIHDDAAPEFILLRPWQTSQGAFQELFVLDGAANFDRASTWSKIAHQLSCA